MQVTPYDGGPERRVVTAAITDVAVLSRIAAKWNSDNGGPAQSKWANLALGWAVSYYRKYGAAPGRMIESAYGQWAARGQDKDTAILMERFLATLSSEYERNGDKPTVEYILDMAGRYFNEVAARRLRDAIDGHLAINGVEAAQAAITAYRKFELGSAAGIDLLSDDASLCAAFDEKHDILINYPGAVGQFFAHAFERDAFISIMSPTGRGKTWCLCDIAWAALLERRKVAFFEVGDMSQAQIMRRFAARAAAEPTSTKPFKYPLTIKRDPESFWAEVELEDRRPQTALTWHGARAAFRAVTEHYVRSDESYFKLSTHPNFSINAEGIKNILDGWANDGWVADVVVIDYADDLAPPSAGHGAGDKREQIDITWKQLRAISQVFHNCVVTATQSDAASYDAVTLRKKHFSEARFKLDHVTGMMGLNQTDAEKVAGVYRLNWVKLREGAYSETKCVYTASCLSLGNPFLLSCW